MLSKCVKGARLKWDEFIPEALFNTRVRTHTTTGYSPFFLLYGVEPRVPGDTSEPYFLNQRNPKDRAEIRAQTLDMRLNELTLSSLQLRRALKKKETLCFLGFISAMDHGIDESISQAAENSEMSPNGK
jgi:hypothetical protein